jgi:hypothetical protein
MELSQSATSSGESKVFPYNVPYSTPIDVGRKFGNPSLFTASTLPSTSDIQDLIIRKDSWINGWSGHDWLLHVTTEQHDAIGVGHRAGTILLRNSPVVSVDAVEYWQPGTTGNNGAWIPGIEGFADQTVGKFVGPGANLQPDSYYVYRKEAKIVWFKQRQDSRLRYRVRYTYGYPSIPDYIRDLSANLAAQETYMIFSGKFMPPMQGVDYMALFKLEEERLLTSITRRPLVAVA